MFPSTETAPFPPADRHPLEVIDWGPLQKE